MQRRGTGGYGADVDGRTLLLGDGTPVVRDAIDVLRLAVFVGAGVYAAGGRWGSAALLARLDVVPDPRDETHLQHYVGIGVVTAALGIAIGALWELFEWRSDAWFGTALSEDDDDTNGDLFRDTLGSLVGAGLLVVWARFGWGSVRRIPGVNTHEEVSA